MDKLAGAFFSKWNMPAYPSAAAVSHCQPVIFVVALVFRQATASHFLSGLLQKSVILTQYELMASNDSLQCLLTSGFFVRKPPLIL